MSQQAAAFLPLLPLAGFIVSATLGRRLGKTLVAVVSCGVMVAAFIVAVALFLGRATHDSSQAVLAWEWIAAGSLQIDIAFLVDPLSLVMLLVVTGVGTLIHVYSIGYMHGDDGFHRFFAYLNLFVFFMLILVLAESLPLMFVGWEGVGLCSYLLIGFWFEKPSAADAGFKAFLVNRVGDFGFMVAMLAAFATFGTLSFSAMVVAGPEVMALHGAGPITLITAMLFLAATGKSAQIPLYVWLPDAMEGPTPVSALIHAATMVTSGIYLIARLFPVFLLVPDVLSWIALVGAVTAAFAATMGLVATDIKKVLAYSTVSQLGYMFLGLGVGAAAGGMFHLVTHAFFKACLFLGAGAVMHALGNETDLRKMGGLRSRIKITWLTMGVSTLAIVGFPGLAGFVSKDAILLAAAQGHGLKLKIALILGILTIGLTAFYMFRLYFMAFHGEPRDAHLAEHAHDATPSMAFALIPLGLLAAVGGFLNWPVAFGGAERFSHFLAPVLRPPQLLHTQLASHHLSLGQELGFSALCLLPAVVGFVLAWMWYARPGATGAQDWARRFPGVYRLLSRRWYVDELYGIVFVGGVLRVSRFAREWVDELFIDGTVTLVGLFTDAVGELVRSFHTGSLRHYALFLALGAGTILIWVVW